METLFFYCSKSAKAVPEKRFDFFKSSVFSVLKSNGRPFGAGIGVSIRDGNSASRVWKIDARNVILNDDYFLKKQDRKTEKKRED